MKVFECPQCKDKIECSDHAIEARCQKCSIWTKVVVKDTSKDRYDRG